MMDIPPTLSFIKSMTPRETKIAPARKLSQTKIVSFLSRPAEASLRPDTTEEACTASLLGEWLMEGPRNKT